MGIRSEKRNLSSMVKIVTMFPSLFKHQGVYLHKSGGDSILQSRGRTPPTIRTSYDRGPSATLRSYGAPPGVGFGILEENKAGSEKRTRTFRARENYFLPLLKMSMSYPLGVFPSLEKGALLVITDLEIWTSS